MFPSPSCPYWFLPRLQTVPSDASARVCCWPAATATIPESRRPGVECSGHTESRTAPVIDTDAVDVSVRQQHETMPVPGRDGADRHRRLEGETDGDGRPCCASGSPDGGSGVRPIPRRCQRRRWPCHASWRRRCCARQRHRHGDRSAGVRQHFIGGRVSVPSCPPRFCPSAMGVPPGARKKVELPPPATVLAACGVGTTKGAGMATTLDSSVTLRTRSLARTSTLAGGAIRFPRRRRSPGGRPPRPSRSIRKGDPRSIPVEDVDPGPRRAQVRAARHERLRFEDLDRVLGPVGNIWRWWSVPPVGRLAAPRYASTGTGISTTVSISANWASK